MTAKRAAGRALSTSTSASGSVNKKPNRPPTTFEARVYQHCAAIPAGKVSTYGEMARALGSCARAVGGAMRRNPFAPTVPCHRVVAADLSLGGFKGSWGPCGPVEQKRAMLTAEGVAIDSSSDRIATKCVVRADELARLAAAAPPLEKVVAAHKKKAAIVAAN